MTLHQDVLHHLLDAQAANDLEARALHNPTTAEVDSLAEWIAALPLAAHDRAEGLRYVSVALSLNTTERRSEHAATGLVDRHAQLGRALSARGMTCKQIAGRLAPSLRAEVPYVRAVSAVRRELAQAGPTRLASRGVAGELSRPQGDRLRQILTDLQAAPARSTPTTTAPGHGREGQAA